MDDAATAASSGTSATPARTESARVAPPGDRSVHLAGADLLGEQDARLLPSRRRDEDERLDPVGDPRGARGSRPGAAGRRGWRTPSGRSPPSRSPAPPRRARPRRRSRRRPGSLQEDELAVALDEELGAERVVGRLEVALHLRCGTAPRSSPAPGSRAEARRRRRSMGTAYTAGPAVLSHDLAPKPRNDHARGVVAVGRRPAAELLVAGRLAEKLLLLVRLPQEVVERDLVDLLDRSFPSARRPRAGRP